MSRVEQWTKDLAENAIEFKDGIVKGLDTPAHLTEAVTYDEETAERDEPYTVGAKKDLDQEYAASDDDFAYEAGRAVGAAGPAVAFLGTANPAALALYAPTAIEGASNAVKENYLD
ncbi:MAG: hypothetical protein SV186_06850 [Candidatus Nanohaloarchaea archaeon]|nr:hypothetical protein [Candidatus Nanohaloarchaea archaeon]